jgi:hypothetical protein
MVFLAEVGSEFRHDGAKELVAGGGVGLDRGFERGPLLAVQVVIRFGNEREEMPWAALQRFPIRRTETRLVITHGVPTSKFSEYSNQPTCSANWQERR